MAHSKEYLIDTGYVDNNKRLRLSNLFLMFQEAAEEHAELLGIGREHTTFIGRKWIITRYTVKINRLPSYGEKVKLFTYPGKNNPFFFYRHFYLKDEEGKLLVVASSIWAILDSKTNKIVTNPFGKRLPEESTEFELPLPPKIEMNTDSIIKEHKIEYSDIDLNGHVNNTRYIELIQNIHDSEFYSTHLVDTFTINYFSEIKEGEIVSLSFASRDEEFIKGSVNGRDCFKALLTYK